MSVRVRVYGFLTVLGVLGGGFFLNQKYGLVGTAAAKAKTDSNKDKKSDSKKDEVAPVELALASRGEISSYISSTGNLRALRDVAIASQIEGIVHKVQAEEGDFVKQGQLLCTLDDTQLKISLNLAQEKLAQAKLQLERAAIRQDKAGVQRANLLVELERYQAGHKEGVVSDQELAQHKYRFDEIQHDEKASLSETREFRHRVAELEAEIAQAKLDISRTQIRAPFAGYVTRRTVDLGQRVRNLDSVYQIGAFTPLYVDVFLSEREAHQIRPGQPAQVRLGVDTATRLKGRVERISPVVDQSTGTTKVTVELVAGATGFRPGAFVRVDIQTDTHSGVVLIPKRAVLEEDGQNFVFVAKGDSARRAQVKLGYESEGLIEILEGVGEGEKVVVAGQGVLKEGSKLKVIQG